MKVEHDTVFKGNIPIIEEILFNFRKKGPGDMCKTIDGMVEEKVRLPPQARLGPLGS